MGLNHRRYSRNEGFLDWSQLLIPWPRWESKLDDISCGLTQREMASASTTCPRYTMHDWILRLSTQILDIGMHSKYAEGAGQVLTCAVTLYPHLVIGMLTANEDDDYYYYSFCSWPLTIPSLFSAHLYYKRANPPLPVMSDVILVNMESRSSWFTVLNKKQTECQNLLNEILNYKIECFLSFVIVKKWLKLSGK